MLPVSLECPLFVTPSVFSNVSIYSCNNYHDLYHYLYQVYQTASFYFADTDEIDEVKSHIDDTKLRRSDLYITKDLTLEE